MERAFGRSFKAVRAHTDAQASRACHAIGANAYTTGNHIAFQSSNPDAVLVAHELAHVIQQRRGVHSQGFPARHDDPAERHADAVARHAVGGGPINDVISASAAPKRTISTTPLQKQSRADQDQATTSNGDPGAGRQAEIAAELGQAQQHVVQADRDSAWAGNFLEVRSPPRALVGNVSPEGGSHRLFYSYHVRYLYLGDTRGGIDGPSGNLITRGHRISDHGGLVYGPHLPSTTPGAYKVWLDNPGGVISDPMHAEEDFTVVDPVRINTDQRRVQRLYDFQNPIPLQMVGDSELKFKLSQSFVHTKRIAVNASGSQGTSVGEKLSFGMQIGLDNDAGSSGGGEWGFSSATQGSYRQQWGQEATHQREISGEDWREYTFHPTAEEAGRSKMLIPTYEWVEWDAEVYPHDPESLLTTGGQRTVVIGMLRPTGEVEEMRSTDSGIRSDSAPTAGAQTDVNPRDEHASSQHRAQIPGSPGWKTLPGARWADADRPNTLQFIQGPLLMQPAGRDYGMQTGSQIHPGNRQESVEFGSSHSVLLQDGLSASRSAERSGVTTNNESKSMEANPGVKGLGSIGDRLSFENDSSLSSSTGTGFSASEQWGRQTTTTVSHTVTKNTNNQFIVFTPLVNHKVFKIGYGARQPTEDRAVREDEFDTFYVHTYQHQPLPHVRILTDVGRNPSIPVGRRHWPRYTEA